MEIHPVFIWLMTALYIKDWSLLIILSIVIAWLLIRHIINKLKPLSLREIKPVGYRLPLKTWNRIQDKVLVAELLFDPHGSDKNDQIMLRYMLLHLMHTFQSKEFGSTFQSPAETSVSFLETPPFSLAIYANLLCFLAAFIILGWSSYTNGLMGWTFYLAWMTLVAPIAIYLYLPQYKKQQCSQLQRTVDRILSFYQAHGRHFDKELKNRVEHFHAVVQDNTGVPETNQSPYEKERRILAALIELFEALKKEVPDYAINGKNRSSGN